MDAAKERKLVEINYEVRSTCELCMHGAFMPGSYWGSCMKHEYDHEKHTDDKMPLSIYVSGVCSDFARDTLADATLGGFSQFRA